MKSTPMIDLLLMYLRERNERDLPPIETFYLHPIDLHALVGEARIDASGWYMRRKPGRNEVYFGDVVLSPQRFVEEGTVVAYARPRHGRDDLLLSTHPLRCRVHEDCLVHPSLAVACLCETKRQERLKERPQITMIRGRRDFEEWSGE